MDFAQARRAMVDNQLRPQAVTDPAVIAAMAVVPRERFVPEAARTLAYIDRALPLGEGRALTPPATLGRMLTELAPREGERALVIGAGTGYAAAVLAEIGLEVTALESDASLEAIANGPRVRRVSGDLAAGAADGAPYDIVLIDGAVEFIPDAISGQLAEGGRLGACLIERGVQRLVIGRKAAGRLGLQSFADASAAPLPGFSKPRAFTF